jgi:hypothetical protein
MTAIPPTPHVRIKFFPTSFRRSIETGVVNFEEGTVQQDVPETHNHTVMQMSLVPEAFAV